MKIARLYLRVSTDEQDLSRQAEIRRRVPALTVPSFYG